ncbi:MAG TPA: cytochrome c [Allosphingosinicella sp.]|nr:cytochrome c [Allosphingosinicella sp.]
MKHALLLGATLVAIPLTAAAQAPSALTPEQIVQTRKAVMALSGGDLAAMKAAADANADVKQLVFSARSMSRWARNLPNMFPDGSNVPPTGAKAEVWSDRAGFTAAATVYADAATRLATAAEAGDRAAFLTAWGEVRGACGACHDAYKD